MKVKILVAINVVLLITIASITICLREQQRQINELDKIAATYEERQQALISRDMALQRELADLKRYVQTGEGAGG